MTQTIMDVRTYKARSIQEALRLIREELGPDAAVLHTREVPSGILGGMFGSRQIEVTASNEVNVPSRLPEELVTQDTLPVSAATSSPLETRPNDAKARLRAHLAADQSPSLVDQLSHRDTVKTQRTAAEFELFTQLIDAGVPDEYARELLEMVVQRVDADESADVHALHEQLTGIVEQNLRVRGAIRLSPARTKVVALVGPTGVGKTTTIAKLAANFRLKQQSRVALITIDTYRIAAVEQLRTYAEIMDLPMEVVATPSEMQAAIERFADFDLVLIDTAGRSPRDTSHIEELRTMIAAANADEIHLVLSSVASGESLQRSVTQFKNLGATHLVLTKIDEAAALGSLLPLLSRCTLPVSYLTNGQNVPQDIASAHKRELTKRLLIADC